MGAGQIHLDKVKDTCAALSRPPSRQREKRLSIPIKVVILVLLERRHMLVFFCELVCNLTAASFEELFIVGMLRRRFARFPEIGHEGRYIPGGNTLRALCKPGAPFT